MSYKLYVDENESNFPTYGGMEIARTLQEALDIINEKGAPNFISFGADFSVDLIEILRDNNLIDADFKYYIHNGILSGEVHRMIESIVLSSLSD